MKINKRMLMLGIIILIVTLIGSGVFYYNNITKNTTDQLSVSDLSVGNCIIPKYSEKFFSEIAWEDSFLTNKVMLGFKEGSDIRLRDGIFVSLCGADVSQINQVVKKYGFTIERLHSSFSEESLNESFEIAKKTFPDASDSNLAFVLNNSKNIDKEEILTAINTLSKMSLVDYVNPNKGTFLPEGGQ